MIKEYREIVAAFQVGTRRVDLPVSAIIPEIPDANREKRLLLQAGIGGLMLDAGAKPTTDFSSIQEAPPEERPIATRAELAIREAFDLGLHRAVKEWAIEAGRRGWVAPHRSLLPLIEYAKKEPQAIVPILGARGRWLAQVTGVEIPSIDIDERQIRRAQDPQGYRDWLSSELPNLGSDERQDAVSALRIQLSAEDEPLLDRVLQDRRKELRTMAGEMLAIIPGSRVSKELIQVADQAISHHKSFLSEKLELELPEVDAAPTWLPKPKTSGDKGPKAERLRQILGWIAPKHWETRFKLGPRKFMELASKNPFSQVLWLGTMQGAIAFRDQSWIDACFLFLFENQPSLIMEWHTVAHWVSEPVFDEAMIRVLRKNEPWGASLIYSLSSRDRPYSRPLTRAIVEHFNGASWRELLMDVLYLLNPFTAADLKIEPPDAPPMNAVQLNRLLAIVPLRQRLLSSLDVR